MPNFHRIFTDVLLMVLLLGLLLMPISTIGLTAFKNDVRFQNNDILGEKDTNVEYYTIIDNDLDENSVSDFETFESTQSTQPLSQ